MLDKINSYNLTCGQSGNWKSYPRILKEGTLCRLTDTSQHSDGTVSTKIIFLPS